MVEPARWFLGTRRVLSTIGTIDVLNLKAKDIRHENTREAFALCSRAYQEAEAIGYEKGCADSLYLIAMCSFVFGEMDASLRAAENAKTICSKLEDLEGEASAYNLIAQIYERANAYDEALTYHHESLRLRRAAGDLSGEAGSLNNIGLVYSTLGQYADALERLFDSLEVAEQAQDKTGLFYAMANIASVLKQTGNLDEALAYNQRALELNRDSKDLAFRTTILKELGHIHALSDDFRTSMNCLEQALNYAKLTGNINDKAQVTLTMAGTFVSYGEYRQAENLLQESLQLMGQTHDRIGESEVLSALGECHLKQGRFAEAISDIDRGLALAERARADRHVARCHSLLSAAYELRGDHNLALGHHKIYHEVWKRLNGQETARRVHALLARSRLESAEREAETHRIRSRQLELALDEAQRQDMEKESLLRQLRRQAEELEQMTREDSLTGLANRRWLDEQLATEFERASRFDHPISVAMIDLDNFKAINDVCSHVVGDRVLRRVAQILQNNCRGIDIVGRYGGDEFMVVLIETPRKQAATVCENIRREVENEDWQIMHADMEKLTVSIGLFDNQGVVTPDELVALADDHLYAAKRGTKNAVYTGK